jgi:aerobic-type carbon monoxide dehydrogenase small subunit (CoxS/CutS family)
LTTLTVTINGRTYGPRDVRVLQKAFIEHFSFQCGYCTSGVLNETQVLLERLSKKPIAWTELDETIAEAAGRSSAPLRRLHQILRGRYPS